MNDAVDEVGVIERRRGAIECLLAEVPCRGPELPQQMTERAAIGREADAPALGVEVPLIPERALAFGRQRLRR